jgi:hypothetical protein
MLRATHRCGPRARRSPREARSVRDARPVQSGRLYVRSARPSKCFDFPKTSTRSVSNFCREGYGATLWARDAARRSSSQSSASARVSKTLNGYLSGDSQVTAVNNPRTMALGDTSPKPTQCR